MKKFLYNNIFLIAGIITGGIAGYFYWRQVGYSSGTCLITSKPLNSTVYGALMGALLLNIFKSNRKKAHKISC